MRKYFVHDGQKEKGPFTIEELSSEDITSETPVWYEGLESWTMAGNVNELKSLFIKKVTPPPLPKSFTTPSPISAAPPSSAPSSPAPSSPAPSSPTLQKSQPLSKSQEEGDLSANKVPDREKILNSFEDAPEADYEPPKKSFLVPILVLLVILGAIITFVILRK